MSHLDFEDKEESRNLNERKRRIHKSNEESEESSEILNREKNVVLRPRTPLQRRDAAKRPLIPPSRRVIASSGQTSFLNKRVERLKAMDQIAI